MCYILYSISQIHHRYYVDRSLIALYYCKILKDS